MEGVPQPVGGGAPAAAPAAPAPSSYSSGTGKGEIWQWVAILGGFTLLTIVVYSVRKEVKLLKLQVATAAVNPPPKSGG